MSFKINRNNEIEQPKIFLRIPNKEGVGELKVNKLSFESNTNDISLMSFTIYKTLNGKEVQYYDLVEEGSLVEAQLQGVYWVVDVEEHGTGVNSYKEIKAKSLQYELKRRKIFDISGVYSLYNVADTDASLMHIICSSLGNWSIGHIDDSLKTLYRTFDIDSSDAYSLLTDDISTSFECIFQFDTYNRIINAYTIDNFGKNTNIFLSYRNLVQENIITSSLDDIITCFKVRGGDDLDIRSVNPTLTDKIYNYDHFMVAKSEGGKASDGLVADWNTYKTLYASLSETQSNNVSLLKTYNAELLELKTRTPSTETTDWTQYGLNELETQEATYTELQSVLLSNGAGSKSSSQYAEYTQTRNTLLAIQAEITVRENEITAKEAQIDALNTSISNIATQLLLSNNFTAEQIKELNSFTFESDYVDETYVVSDEDSEETALEVKQQLYNVAVKELDRVSKQQFTLETTMSNLFMLPEFAEYQEDFELGNIIKIRFNKISVATARLLSIKIDFDKLEDITVVFANRNKLDSSTITFAKVQAQASQTSNTVSVSGIGWDKAASKTNEIQEYMNSTLNAANQEIVNSDDQEVTFGSYGLRLREKDKLTGLYSSEEAWFVKNKLMFSNDNFESSIAGIGKFTNPDTGESFYGFIGEAIVSNLVLSSALKIYNASGTYTITDATGFQATATSGSNTYTVGINPNTPTEIFKIAVNGINKLYVDVANSKLVFSGTLSGSDGTFSGTVSAGTITGSTISGGSITGTSINIGSGNFTVDSSGNCTAKSIDVKGGSFEIGSNFSVSRSGVLTAKSAVFSGTIEGSDISGSSLTSFGYDTGNSPQKTLISNGTITTNLIYVRPINGTTEDFSIDSAGYVMINALEIGISKDGSSFPFYADRNGNVTLTKVNGYTPLHLGNYDDWCVKLDDYHTNQITPDLTSSGNIGFNGKNAASVTWCNDTFQPISTSDMRLKKNILTLDIPDELFLALKPKQYEFKSSNYPTTKVFGFLAQELESVFESFNLSPFEYNIIDKMNIRTYTDEGQYVDDYIHRINYENFHAIEILMIQKLYARVQELEQKLNNI